MKSAVILLIAGAVLPVLPLAPDDTPASGPAVTLAVQPATPLAGTDFTIAVYVDLEGVTGASSTAVALGGFVIPLAFDNSRVTLKSVANGSASEFTADLVYTGIRNANARGYVTLVNAHTGAGIPTGIVHVATLTFMADQGGTVQFNVNSARARWEGSLSSARDPSSSVGPEPLAYVDLVTTVPLQQGSSPFRLIYPSLVSTSSEFQGVAVVNESSAPATLTFRAYSVEGELLARTGMANPNNAALDAHAQSAKLAEEIFSMREILATDHGWIEVESTSSDISGFFLVGRTKNGIPTALDGADASHNPTAHAIFPTMGGDIIKETRIFVVNPGSDPATGRLKIQKSDGATQQPFPLSIPAHGVFERTYQSEGLSGGGYAELEMTNGRIVGLEKFGGANALACLAAQDVGKAADFLCAPHLASGKAGLRYFTEVSVINTSKQMASVIFRLLNDEGAEIVSPVTRSIAAASQLRSRVDRLFGLPDPATTEGYTTGIVMLECDRELVGSITFGDFEGNILSSLPLLSTSSAKREIFMDHVALGTVAPVTYWTGISIVNASREREAHATFRLYRSNGELVGETARTIPRKGRLLKLVSELGPGFNISQFGGYLKVTSDLELFAFMLFGDLGPTFLSAVPVR